MIKLKKLTIIYGHYGSGKTNLSLNLAMDLARKGEKVTLVDMDIVNPYFRSSDYSDDLKAVGIEVIAPGFAGSNLDTPSLSPEIYSVFTKQDRYIIFDVGGDDAGAFALGRFAEEIEQFNNGEVYYVINKYRNFTDTPQKAQEILREIEQACSLKATGIINNSHLQNETGAEEVLSSMPYAEETAKLLDLPLITTTALKEVAKDKKLSGYNIYPVDMIVKPPF